jgi:hypothetical protein
MCNACPICEIVVVVRGVNLRSTFAILFSLTCSSITFGGGATLPFPLLEEREEEGREGREEDDEEESGCDRPEKLMGESACCLCGGENKRLI